jgi:peroxiredoxin
LDSDAGLYVFMRKPPTMTATALMIVAAAIAVVSCRRAAAPVAAAACPADAQRASLDFTLKDLDGREVRLADYKGKVLLLDFWATWCVPCKIEIPAFVDLYAKYKERGFEVAGVVVLDRFANVKPFAERYKMNYTVLDGTDRPDIDAAYGRLVVGLPTSFLISRDGRICSTHVGLPASPSPDIPIERAVREKFEAEIKSLL